MEPMLIVQHFKKIVNFKLSEIAKNNNLSINEILILSYLYYSNKNLATNITNDLGFTKSHVSLSINLLKKKGFIEKVRDTTNKKNIHIKLKQKAGDIVKQVLLEKENLFNKIKYNISDSDWVQFVTTLSKIEKNLKGMIKKDENI